MNFRQYLTSSAFMMILEVTCADFPCKNNGTCVDTGTLYICACASGTGRTVKMN